MKRKLAIDTYSHGWQRVYTWLNREDLHNMLSTCSLIHQLYRQTFVQTYSWPNHKFPLGAKRMTVITAKHNFPIPKHVTDLRFLINQEIQIPNDLTRLCFGDKFNRKVVIPETVTDLSFGNEFDKPVIIPSRVRTLKFGIRFNRDLELPCALEHLEFAKYSIFQCKLTFPSNLKTLTLGRIFNRPLSLPSGLTWLRLSEYFTHPIELPNNLTHLNFKNSFNQPIALPKSLLCFKAGRLFNQPIEYPPGLQTLKVQSLVPMLGFEAVTTLTIMHNLPVIIPCNVTHLRFGDEFNQPVYIPNKVRYLKFGCKFNQNHPPPMLPDGLETLIFSSVLQNHIPIPCSVKNLSLNTVVALTENLPKALKKLSFVHCHVHIRMDYFLQFHALQILKTGWAFNQPVHLPPSLTHLKLGRNFNQEIFLPSNLTLLELGRHFQRKIALPLGLREISVDRFFKFQNILSPGPLRSLCDLQNFISRVEIRV